MKSEINLNPQKDAAADKRMSEKWVTIGDECWWNRMEDDAISIYCHCPRKFTTSADGWLNVDHLDFNGFECHTAGSLISNIHCAYPYNKMVLLFYATPQDEDRVNRRRVYQN